MAVLIIHERVLGKHKRLSSVPIKNGQVIASDSKRIAQINRELRKKNASFKDKMTLKPQ